MTIGIDATNILQGGGVTHLAELLNHSNPQVHGFDNIVVWAPEKTLQKITDKPWIVKKTNTQLNRSLLYRTGWKSFKFSRELETEKCNILFVPGGSDATGFTPMVTMSQNMLPFELREAFRFGLGFMVAKLLALRFVQSRSFKRAQGLIFLTNYAKNEVSKIVRLSNKRVATIPHGISKRFFIEPKEQRQSFTEENPCKLIYVSIIDPYKHHLQLLEAIKMLRQKKLPIQLDLIGPPGYSFAAFREKMNQINADETVVHYHGAVSYEALHGYYSKADIGIFASSCENMPNILLEMMAAGLPIACSNKGPMPEMLQDSGVYFNPDSPGEIAKAIEELFISADLREKSSTGAYEKAKQYSWQKCADETFAFLNTVHSSFYQNNNNLSDL